MKIVFFGDSITDAGRSRTVDHTLFSYGCGFVREIAGVLLAENPTGYEILNRGISGDRIVDLYARIKADVWEQSPDVVSILVGLNDLGHEILFKNGVDLTRFERIYKTMIEETQERLPNARIILCEPFVLCGTETEANFDRYQGVAAYANVVKSIAESKGLDFVPLQKKLSEGAEKYGGQYYLSDGVHPNIAGATLLAEEWLKVFKK